MSNLWKINMLKAVGKQKDSSGKTAYLSPSILKELASTYDPGLYESQLVIGHNDDLKAMLKGDKAPSFGHIKSVHLENDDTELWGVVELIDEAHEWVERGLYKHVSLAYYEPGNPYGVIEDKHYIRHLALLGATPPAIKGLDRFIKLSEDEEMVKQQTKALQEGEVLEVEQQTTAIEAPSLDAPPEEIASFMNENAVDFLINILTEGEFGFQGEIVKFDPEPSQENNFLMNDAGVIEGKFTDEEGEVYLFEIQGDKKSFRPENTEEEESLVAATEVIAEEEEDQLASLMSQFSDYVCGHDKDAYKHKMPDGKMLIIKVVADDSMMEYQEELAMPISDKAMMEINALKEELNALREADKKRRYAELNAFCEGLYSDGRLLETVTPKEEVLAFMESLDGNQMLAFGEGKESSTLDWLKGLLGQLPVQLPMTALSETESKSYKFNAPSQMGVDAGQMRIFNEAKAISEEANIPFAEALTRVSV